MSDERNSKRRKMSKNYYANQNKPKNYLEPCIRGFLATCNFREKDCVRECYNLLNEYADQTTSASIDEAVIASEKPQSKEAISDGSTTTGEPPQQNEEEEEKDISELLEKEIKTITSKTVDRNRFQQVETKVNNCIFIKTTVADPNELGVRLMRDIAEKQQQKTRYLQRIWPVDTVCRANLEDIKNACGKLFDKVFLNVEPTTFSIVVNKRLNNSLDRMKIIEELAKLIDFKSSAHKVDLKNPKITVNIEIIKGLCCVSLLPDYFKLKKYNVFELTKKDEEKPANGDNDKKEDAKPTDEVRASENGGEISGNVPVEAIPAIQGAVDSSNTEDSKTADVEEISSNDQ